MSALPQIVHAATDAEGVRFRIHDAAERVFAARGYAGATTREIARPAGVRNRGLLPLIFELLGPAARGPRPPRTARKPQPPPPPRAPRRAPPRRPPARP